MRIGKLEAGVYFDKYLGLPYVFRTKADNYEQALLFGHTWAVRIHIPPLMFEVLRIPDYAKD